MARIAYTARRGLGPSHSAGVNYEITPKVVTADRSVRDLKERQESLSGKVETCFMGSVSTWSIRLEPMTYQDAVYVREMLESTADGQTFEIDPYGTLSNEVRSMNVVRDDDGYTEERFVQVGSNGSTDFFTYGFRVREV